MVRSRAVVVVSVLTAASVLGWWFGETRGAVSRQYRVVQVLDGDTVVVQRDGGAETIRLLGVDTPETHHPRKPVQCYGPEASAYTARRPATQLATQMPHRRPLRHWVNVPEAFVLLDPARS